MTKENMPESKEYDFAGAIEYIKDRVLHPSNCEYCDMHRPAIQTALKIADRLQRGHVYHGMAAQQLIKECSDD